MKLCNLLLWRLRFSINSLGPRAAVFALAYTSGWADIHNTACHLL